MNKPCRSKRKFSGKGTIRRRVRRDFAKFWDIAALTKSIHQSSYSMSKLFFCGILLALSFEVSQAQPKAPEKLFGGDEPAKFHKNVFVEVLGNGLLVSANYDMRLKRGIQDGLGFRVGVGGGRIEGTTNDGDYLDASLLTIPLSVNYLVGKRRSAFEAGIGVTPVFVNADLAIIDDEITYGKGWGAIGFLNLGYRFQPIRNGVMFRADWTPVIYSEGFSPGFFGVSLGFGFK